MLLTSVLFFPERGVLTVLEVCLSVVGRVSSEVTLSSWFCVLSTCDVGPLGEYDPELRLGSLGTRKHRKTPWTIDRQEETCRVLRTGPFFKGLLR